MSKVLKYMLCGLLLLAGGNLYAQFNPTNPSEPSLNLYHDVTVQASPASAGYVSGGGRLLEGSTQSVSTSSRSTNYVFSHWTLNGEVYSSESRLSYNVATADMEFVAHYSFVPASPSEPVVIIKNPLYLVPSPEGACTFNRTSGAVVEFDQWVTVTTYGATGYDFLGWYDSNGAFVSEYTSFNYQMPDEPVTLVARYEYNPVLPGEPESDGTQTNVQITPRGDVNKDYSVDLQDIVIVLNSFLGKTADEESSVLCDLNGDGTVDVEDVVIVLNVFLKK